MQRYRGSVPDPLHRAVLIRSVSWAAFTTILHHSSPLLACDGAAPWSRLGASARQIAAPVPLTLAASALLVPLTMAPSGADHELRLLSQRELGGRPNLEPVSVWTPFLLPVALLAVDSVAYGVGACDVARSSAAMLQGMGVTFLTIAGLKWVTGRTWPNAGRDPNAPDRLEHPEFARRFHWFSIDQGSAWPSGHSATMVAAATALVTATRGRSWLGYVAITAATGVAAGMWLGDHPWASEIVSGSLIGVALGYGIGSAFREEPTPGTQASLAITPWKTADIDGIRLAVAW